MKRLNKNCNRDLRVYSSLQDIQLKKILKILVHSKALKTERLGSETLTSNPG